MIKASLVSCPQRCLRPNPAELLALVPGMLQLKPFRGPLRLQRIVQHLHSLSARVMADEAVPTFEIALYAGWGHRFRKAYGLSKGSIE